MRILKEIKAQTRTYSHKDMYMNVFKQCIDILNNRNGYSTPLRYSTDGMDVDCVSTLCLALPSLPDRERGLFF